MRNLKVGYRWIDLRSTYAAIRRGKHTPKITIQGDYLKNAGFDIGTYTNVLIEQDKITITRI